MYKSWISISFILMMISSAANLSFESRAMEEICDNAIDDDGDGLIDLNDPDCICELVSNESLIPNPSFEDYDCCPDSDSQLDCAVGWDQASGGTTDYLNTCDYLAVSHSLLPFPDGDGAVLFLTGTVDNGTGPEIYKEYTGACLNSPMLEGSTYIIKFHLGFLAAVSSPEIRFSFFGSPTCDELPFSIFSDCPTNNPNWYFLNGEYITGDQFPGWVEVTMVINPSFDIHALVLGADCSHDSEGELRVYLLDNLRLNEESTFDFELLDNGHPCDSNFIFAVAETSNSSYQWYLEGIALIGETDAELSQMYGEGSYQLRIVNENTQQCRISDDYEYTIPIFENEVFEIICEGESFIYQGDVIENAGIYNYTLSSIDGCDSIVMLHVEQQQLIESTVYAQILSGATYSIEGFEFKDEGTHQINLTTPSGCESIITLHLEYIKVFIPNAFSPNGDGINDYFEVFTSDDEFVSKEMSIFDRWGNLIFEGDKWDGRLNNKFLNTGVYVYLIKLIDSSGYELTFANSITLIR